MKITVEVVGGSRFGPGKAIVRIDGEVYARLRTDEEFEIEVRQELVTRSHVKPPWPAQVGNGRQGCEWCKGDDSLCDGTECKK